MYPVLSVLRLTAHPAFGICWGETSRQPPATSQLLPVVLFLIHRVFPLYICVLHFVADIVGVEAKTTQKNCIFRGFICRFIVLDLVS